MNRCENCRYCQWEPDNWVCRDESGNYTEEKRPPREGECRYCPPERNSRDQFAWPCVNLKTGWCGMFSARPEEVEQCE